MKKTIIAVLLICTVCAVNAQNKCDELYGKWIFTRWQMDHLLLDIEDSAATVQYRFREYKEANNGASMSAADSLQLVNELSKELARIKTNGFMSFTLNRNKTFTWKGSVNDPNLQLSGTYSCNGGTITLNAMKNKDTHKIILQLISLSKNRITIQFPADSNSDTKSSTVSFPDSKNNRMSFKRVP